MCIFRNRYIIFVNNNYTIVFGCSVLIVRRHTIQIFLWNWKTDWRTTFKTKTTIRLNFTLINDQYDQRPIGRFQGKSGAHLESLVVGRWTPPEMFWTLIKLKIVTLIYTQHHRIPVRIRFWVLSGPPGRFFPTMYVFEMQRTVQGSILLGHLTILLVQQVSIV